MVLSSFSNKLVASAIGQTSYGDVVYITTAQNITGLLAPGAVGVNHGQHTRHQLSDLLTWPLSGIAQDGIVTLLTVTIYSDIHTPL